MGAIKGDQARFAELADSVQSLLQELVSLAAFYHGVRHCCSKGSGRESAARRYKRGVVNTCYLLTCMIWNDGWLCSSCPRTPSWDPRCYVAGGRSSGSHR